MQIYYIAAIFTNIEFSTSNIILIVEGLMPRNKKIFPIDDIKLTSIYEDIPSNYNYLPLSSTKIQAVYGSSLLLPPLNSNRPLVVSSFVESIDGKITYKNSNGGTLIANSNFKDKKGGLADFWLMNMLRAVSDAVIIGSSMLHECIDSVAHIYDNDLEKDRLINNKPAMPMNILPTLTGQSIDYSNKIFQQEDLSLLIVSTKQGIKHVKKHLLCPYIEIIADDLDNLNYTVANTIGKVLIVGVGEKLIDNHLFLKILKKMGINLISVEASYYFHNLLQDKLVDEIFLNYSGIYLGGEHIGIAEKAKGFSVNNHPHCRILSLKMHSPYFIYTRQKFEYN